uniref:RING-type domain-containing protein n=1 Tax=Plectus sambesii TaxID=2011161 RepID=A0A914UHV1_9BILA
MATSMNSFHNHCDCGICLSNFKLPVKVLLCGHSYCGSCLAPLGGQGQIQCPACGMVTFLSVHGVPGLTNNYALHQILRGSRPAAEMGLDFGLLGPPPPVILPTPANVAPSAQPPNGMHLSRSATPDFHSVPSIQVTPTVSPILASSSHGHGPVNLPAHSAIVIDTPANVVVGQFSMVVTDANCSVAVGKECRIFRQVC